TERSTAAPCPSAAAWRCVHNGRSCSSTCCDLPGVTHELQTSLSVTNKLIISRNGNMLSRIRQQSADLSSGGFRHPGIPGGPVAPGPDQEIDEYPHLGGQVTPAW